MNSRKIAIITAIGLLIISVIAFAFFKEVRKENTPVPIQPMVRQVVEETPRAGHLIPKSTVHSLNEMKERIKKAEEDRMRSQGIAVNAGSETAKIEVKEEEWVAAAP